MNQIKVSAKRHLAKTISYRIISTLVGFLIMWWATGSVEFGAAFGAVELLYKPIQYYIHERIWYRWIKFGLVEVKSKNDIPTRKINNHLQDIILGSNTPPPPQSEPKLIKEGKQPIKRLIYSKKSDKQSDFFLSSIKVFIDMDKKIENILNLYENILFNKKICGINEVTDFYNNIDFKDNVVGNSKPSRDNINTSLLNDIEIAA